MIKGSIQEEDITTVSIYASNIGAQQNSVKQLSFNKKIKWKKKIF